MPRATSHNKFSFTNSFTRPENAERGAGAEPCYRVPMRYTMAPPSRLERLTRSLGKRAAAPPLRDTLPLFGIRTQRIQFAACLSMPLNAPEFLHEFLHGLEGGAQ